MIEIGGKKLRGVWMKHPQRNDGARWFPNAEVGQAYSDGWRVDVRGYTANRFASSTINDICDACRTASEIEVTA